MDRGWPEDRQRTKKKTEDGQRMDRGWTEDGQRTKKRQRMDRGRTEDGQRMDRGNLETHISASYGQILKIFISACSS